MRRYANKAGSRPPIDHFLQADLSLLILSVYAFGIHLRLESERRRLSGA
jgi:hypothetical protein